MLFKPGAAFLDYICVGNNPDLQHMVGK